MSEIRSLLTEMRYKRWNDDAQLASVTEAQMYTPTAFTMETMMTNQPGEIGDIKVRWLFLRRADHMEEHSIQIAGLLRNQFAVPTTQAHLYWAANQQARADLYAALCGLTDLDLDDVPDEPEGEWSLRQILEHLIGAERAYASRAVYAVECQHAGKPYGGHPTLDNMPREWPGASLTDLIAEFDRAREDSLRLLINLTDEELRAPQVWGGMDIDVRFQLMRFAQHEREHTAQIRKWRLQCGKPYTEADRLLGLAWQANGRLEATLAGAPDDVLDRDPANGDWPIRRILAHISSAESYFKRMVDGALQ
jgi:uncharacterized damage-inducible protein DinB